MASILSRPQCVQTIGQFRHKCIDFQALRDLTIRCRSDIKTAPDVTNHIWNKTKHTISQHIVLSIGDVENDVSELFCVTCNLQVHSQFDIKCPNFNTFLTTHFEHLNIIEHVLPPNVLDMFIDQKTCFQDCCLHNTWRTCSPIKCCACCVLSHMKCYFLSWCTI